MDVASVLDSEGSLFLVHLVLDVIRFVLTPLALLLKVVVKLPILLSVLTGHSIVVTQILIGECSHVVLAVTCLFHGLARGQGISLHTCVHLREEQAKHTLTILPL